MDLQPLTDFISQNSTLLAKGGAGGSAAVVLRPVGKMLLERCSEYLGIINQAKEITKRAQAEGQAEVIRAHHALTAEVINSLVEIKLSESEKRGLARSIRGEGKKQRNIDSIVLKALEHIDDNAQPQNIDEDWLENFFDKSQLVSDDEMQLLFSRILSGEANSPGSYSKRVVNTIQSMSQKEAQSFSKICQFCAFCDGRPVPFIFSTSDGIYTSNGLTPENVTHCIESGLIIHNPAGFSYPQNTIKFIKYGKSLIISPENISLEAGVIAFTESGFQLFKIVTVEPIENFDIYVEKQIGSSGRLVQ